MLFAVLGSGTLNQPRNKDISKAMARDDKITHSIICEHTRKLAAHDKSTSIINRKIKQRAATAEARLKEFNRSRPMLLAQGLKLRRRAKGLPDDF
jgi:hypothetical protein